MNMTTEQKRLIGTIIVVFTLLQVLSIPLLGYTPYPDSNGYLLMARDCVAHQQFYPMMSQLGSDSFVWNLGSINAVVVSLYLFGSANPLLYFYAVLKGLSAFFVFDIARRQFSFRTALIALAVYVLYPANYGEATSFLSELPFTFFALLGIWLTMLRKPLCGGMSLALANFMRPMGLVFLLSLVIYLLILRLKKPVVSVIMGYVAVVLVLGTVNYSRTGYFLYQAKTGWMSLLQYSVDHSPADDARLTDNGNLDAVRSDSLWQRRWFEWVSHNKKEYVAQMPEKFIRTYVSDNVNLCAFLPEKSNGDTMYETISMPTLLSSFPHYKAVQWLTVLNLLYYYALMALFIIGSVLMISRGLYSQAALPVSIVVIGTALLLFFGHGEARFHIIFMPFVIISAAWTLAFFFGKQQRIG